MFGYFCQWQGLTWPLQYSAYLEVWGIMKMLKGPVGSVSKTVFDFCRPPTSRWNFSKFAKLVHGWIDCEVKVRILTETNNSSAGDGVATLALWPFIGGKKILIHSIFLEGLGFQVRYGMIGDVDRTMRSGKCLSVDKAYMFTGTQNIGCTVGRGEICPNG